MLKEIAKSDIITRPIKVYKEWTLDENDINPIFGSNDDGSLVDLDNDERSHGFNKKVIYASIKSQFYRNTATASILTEVGKRKSYASSDERVLDGNIAVFSIPQIKYGEGIKVKTVTLQDDTVGKLYTDDGYSNLIDTTGSIVGNIFYDRGLVVLTKNVVSGSILNEFTLNFRSTKTIYENEIFISVLENEFNYSQNPSALYDNYYIRGVHHPYVSEIDSAKFGSFDDFEYSSSLDPTGSYLAPYITTIGLYDNELNMIAVAKLPQPIKSEPNYPLNFIVRFDT